MADLRKTPPPNPGEARSPTPEGLRRWLPLGAVAFAFCVIAAGVAVLADEGGLRTVGIVAPVMVGFAITSFISVQLARQNGWSSDGGGGSD